MQNISYKYQSKTSKISDIHEIELEFLQDLCNACNVLTMSFCYIFLASNDLTIKTIHFKIYLIDI